MTEYVPEGTTTIVNKWGYCARHNMICENCDVYGCCARPCGCPFDAVTNDRKLKYCPYCGEELPND